MENTFENQLKLSQLSIFCSVHRDQKCLGLCLNMYCKHESRLICPKCMIKSHSDDSKFIVLFDELDKSNVYMTENWPFLKGIESYKQYIEFQDDKIFKNHIDKIFLDLLNDFTEKLQKVKKDIIVNLQTKQHQLKQKQTEIEDFLRSEFGLDKIKQVINEQLLCYLVLKSDNSYQPLNANLFEESLNSLLNKQLQIQDFKEKNIEFLKHINQMEQITNLNTKKIYESYDQMKENINEALSKLQQQLTRSSSNILPFIVSKYEDSENFIEIQNNVLWFKEGGYAKQCYTQILKFEKSYDFKMKFELNAIDRCYGIGIVKEGKQDLSLGFPESQNGVAVCLHCQNTKGNFKKHEQQEAFGQLIQTNRDLELQIQICLQENIFIIETNDRQYIKELADFNFSTTNEWRFFVFRYTKETKMIII